MVILLLVLLADFSAKAQSVSGTVRSSADNQPLAGVSVKVGTSDNGAITNDQGVYQVNNVSYVDRLIFSFIGYETKEVVIGNQKTLDIFLDQTASSLDQVVVIGYGTQKKQDLTGAISIVNMEEKGMAPNLSLLEGIRGSTPGVNVTGGGLAGQEQDIQIRAQSTLSASTQPLLVVDGIIYPGSLMDININNIETISVLKDASATAIYGSRSSNGVILVTTKRGKTSKPMFNFNIYGGVQSMSNNKMRFMNAQEYAIRLVDYYYQQRLYSWYQTDPQNNDGKPIRLDINDRQLVAQSLRTQEESNNYLNGKDIDWLDEVIRTGAPIQNYNFSISGRTEKTNYFLSGSYLDDKGILLNDNYKQTTIHSRFENKISDWLKIGLTTSYSFRDYSGLQASFDDAKVASPLANVRDSLTGQYITYLTGEVYMPNPLIAPTVNDVEKYNNLFNIISAEIKIPQIEGLQYDFNFSTSYLLGEHSDFYPVNSPRGASNVGVGIKENSKETDWILNNIISYNRSIGSDHRISATLLYSAEHRSGENTHAEARKFGNDVLGFNSLQLGTIPIVNSGGWEQSGLSYMARLFYSFKSKYLITGTIRKDGFSGFGPFNKFATFPSVSVAWDMREEDFMERLDWLNELKIRASVGKTGNQGIGRYSSFSRMATSAYVYGSTSVIGVYPSILGNKELRWETSLSYNLGIDFSALNGRISGDINFYSSKTSNVLVNRNLPRITGYGNVWSNIGSIHTEGFDIGLNTVNMDGLVNWKSSLSFSLDRNKLTKLYGSIERDLGNSWFVGQPIHAIYDLQMVGDVYTEDEFYKGQVPPGFYPGQFRYKDLNGDGQIDYDNDRTIIGYEEPNYRIGLNNVLTFKNWVFSVFINSIQGGNNYYLKNNFSNVISASIDQDPATGKFASDVDNTYRMNAPAVRPYWTPDNGVTNSPGIYFAPRAVGGLYQSRSFIRIQDVSLRYRFDGSILQSMRIQDLTVYASGKNLYTFTKWVGWDPENLANVPMIRSLILGINLSF